VGDDGAYAEVHDGWPTYFGPLVNAWSVVNYAKSGASYRDRDGISSEWQKISHQVTKAIEHGVHADVVIVAAGTNDGTAALGDFATATAKTTLGELDRTLLYEALRWTFWSIRSAYPNATCFAALPIQRADRSPESQEPLYDAIRRMGRRYNCILVEGTWESGIVAEFEVWQGPGRHLEDGLHPNPAGDMALAKLFARSVRNGLNY
jgi:lysophospholipase L1-like esterase